MKLHVFNPEHDIALARNDKYFTAPRAGRQLRNDCGFIPALWADEGDYVLVNDVDRAKQLLESKLEYLSKEEQEKVGNVTFITFDDVKHLPYDVSIEPWGWDSSICWQLHRAGIKSELLLSESQLDVIRELSNRRFSSRILSQLREEHEFQGMDIVGESQYITDFGNLKSMVADLGNSVLKEPWSSSGRGVRYVGNHLDGPTENWANNIITKQGGIMIEPYYNKVCDFGMEFIADNSGTHYKGLSVFMTSNGFYTGNLVASEEQKQLIMAKYISKDMLESVSSAIENMLSVMLKGKYSGPLGVDMMIVDDGKGDALCLHPMVEINMRRTMGHMAIDLFGRLKAMYSYFHINFTSGNYSLEFTSRL